MLKAAFNPGLYFKAKRDGNAELISFLRRNLSIIWLDDDC